MPVTDLLEWFNRYGVDPRNPPPAGSGHRIGSFELFDDFVEPGFCFVVPSLDRECLAPRPSVRPAEPCAPLRRACVPFINVQPNLKQTVPLGTFSARRIKGMREERRLVWRVLRHWKEIADGGRFPRRDEIVPWLQGEDGANCLLIAVGWSIELSHFIVVGVNLAGALCATDTLAGVLLSSVPQVVSSRCGLMMEGVAMLRRVDIRYRTVLLPVSEVGATINYVLGATNYRSLRV